MFHMVTRRSLAAVGLASILAAPMAWSQDAPPVRVRGTIERTEGPVFVVKSRDGTELKIVLADNAVAVGVVKAALAHQAGLVRGYRRDAAVGWCPTSPGGPNLPGRDARNGRRTLSMGSSAEEHHDERQCRAGCHCG